MKKIKVLKLGNLEHQVLKQKEEEALKGGTWCWFDNKDNYHANYEAGKCSCACGITNFPSDYYSGLNADASDFKQY